MTKIRACLSGASPRLPELIEGTIKYKKGEMDQKKLDGLFYESAQEVVRIQIECGLEPLIDGMLGWNDLFHPFVDGIESVESGPLTRWFDNNTFFRKPVIKSRIVESEGKTKKIRENINPYGHRGLFPMEKEWKIIVPSPYCFSKLSEMDSCYDKKTDLMGNYTDLLVELVKGMNCDYVQLNDPSLCWEDTSKDMIIKIKEGLDYLKKKDTTKKFIYHTYFGDFSKCLPEILEFPTEYLGVDMIKTNYKNILDYKFSGGICIGLIDARNTLLENQGVAAEIVERVVDSVDPKGVFVMPNTDLDFLPWEFAVEKIKLLAGILERMKKGDYTYEKNF